MIQVLRKEHGRAFPGVIWKPVIKTNANKIGKTAQRINISNLSEKEKPPDLY